MLWILIRSASLRRFYEYQQHMFLWRNKKNINTFGLKKSSYQELCNALNKATHVLLEYELHILRNILQIYHGVHVILMNHNKTILMNHNDVKYNENQF